ncbi:MAG: putative ABC exporter domain-containing protein [Clostridia bacterium]|nr:putative ABC exporter domain-containing protein [Clostridia bacterium]
MSALTYLLTRKLKNNILSVLKTPSKLIFVLILAAFMIFTALTGNEAVQENIYGFRDINELYAIVMLLYSIVFVMISKNGFYNGASMFSMADVNMIFTAPLNQSKVLSFGLFQQLGRSLLIGYFILYQSTLVRDTYGVGFSALIYILIGYGVTVFLAQMTAMVVYSLTSCSDKKKTALKWVCMIFVGCFVAYTALSAYKDGGITIANLVLASRSMVLRFFPVSGITALAVEGAIQGEPLKIAGGAAYCIGFWLLYRLAIKLINSDYYEDVLQSTEVSYSAIQARKEGKAAENAPRNVKTGKIGINKGFGASVIAEKHKIENRRSKVFLLSTMSLVMIAFSVLGCFIFSDMPVGIFVLNVYMLTMGVAAGRWGKELAYPYIYLIPEKPHIKLWYTIKGEFMPLIAESILCFIPVYFIAHTNISETLGMIAGRISFGLLFISVNLLLQRLFGSSDKKFLILIAYFLFILLFSAPGIFTAVTISVLYPFYFIAAYFIMSAVNIVVAAVLAFCCRNTLSISN